MSEFPDEPIVQAMYRYCQTQGIAEQILDAMSEDIMHPYADNISYLQDYDPQIVEIAFCTVRESLDYKQSAWEDQA